MSLEDRKTYLWIETKGEARCCRVRWESKATEQKKLCVARFKDLKCRADYRVQCSATGFCTTPMATGPGLFLPPSFVPPHSVDSSLKSLFSFIWHRDPSHRGSSFTLCHPLLQVFSSLYLSQFWISQSLERSEDHFSKPPINYNVPQRSIL